MYQSKTQDKKTPESNYPNSIDCFSQFKIDSYTQVIRIHGGCAQCGSQNLNDEFLWQKGIFIHSALAYYLHNLFYFHFCTKESLSGFDALKAQMLLIHLEKSKGLYIGKLDAIITNQFGATNTSLPVFN